MAKEQEQQGLAIFQTKSGALRIRTDMEHNTIWANQADLALLYDKDQSVISRHIRNIFKDKEVDEKSNMQKMHIPNSDKPVSFYSLDIVLAVGYRTNSASAIRFRQWANNILKQHITKGFTINPEIVEKNKVQFLKTIEDLKLLSKNTSNLEATDVLSLIQNFSHTWFSLESYDKGDFPTQGTQEEIQLSASELIEDLQELKANLMKAGQATPLFGQEKRKGAMEGILGSVFQSVFGQDAYPSIEEKAAHLLYFTVKNHPFNDGNKRSGAFCFVWLLQKANYSFSHKITPEALTALTLLIAESDPMVKDKLIGLILLLLKE